MVKKKEGNQESKKTVQKKKQQAVEDKTFGLKNKSKSKKVQQQVESITRNVMNSGDPKVRKMEELRAKQKAERKVLAKAAKEEQDALFGAALLAVQKKSNVDKKGGKIEAQGRDANDDGAKKSTSRAMKMMYQMDADEMNEKLKEDPNYVPTLEDEVEDQRQKKVAELKAKFNGGTKVTPETFAVWQEAKRKKRAEEIKKMVEAELRKKKGGKGLSILTGRALYEYNQKLFQDRDDDDMDIEIKDDDDDDDNDGEEGDSKPAAESQNGEPKEEEQKEEEEEVEKVADQVESALFLEGNDDDLDDIDDD